MRKLLSSIVHGSIMIFSFEVKSNIHGSSVINSYEAQIQRPMVCTCSSLLINNRVECSVKFLNVIEDLCAFLLYRLATRMGSCIET